ERNRLKRKERFAGVVHWFDLFLKAPRRNQSPKLPRCVHIDSLGPTRLLPNVADIAAIAHVRTCEVCSDTDDVAGRGDSGAGVNAHSDVPAAASVVYKRAKPNGRVVVADAVVKESITAGSRVAVAGAVTNERPITIGRVL